MSDDPANGGRLLVCLHGVGGGPEDFAGWTRALPRWRVEVPDLQGHSADLSNASMDEFAAAGSAALPAQGDVFVCGWSMGGLVALMIAARHDVSGVVLIEPSLPAEVAGVQPEVPLVAGTFDPDEVYGPRGDGVSARRDSTYAASERKRGVFVGAVRCPVLVVGGATFTATRSKPIADHLAAPLLEYPDLHHVALLHDLRVLADVGTWLEVQLSGRARPPRAG